MTFDPRSEARISAAVQWVERQMAAPPPPNFRLGPLSAPSTEGLPFKAHEETPAYAVITALDNEYTGDTATWGDEPGIVGYKPKSLPGEFGVRVIGWNRLYAINGPAIVAAGETGRAHLAHEKPVWALIRKPPEAYAWTPDIGDPVGPADDRWELYSHLPGFVVVGPPKEYDDSRWLAPVLACPEQVLHLKARVNWSLEESNIDEFGVVCASIEGHPCTDESGTHQYDGTDLTPKMEFWCPLYRYKIGDANVVAGQVFLYQSRGFLDTPLAVGEYLDAQIGAIEIRADVHTRQGWGLMNGTDNSVANGGTGKDMRNAFPAGMMGGSTFAATGTAYTYRSLFFYERLRNSSNA
jgi:hypothetical protein